MSDVITSPIKAIRKYCLECCKESANEVKLCPAEGCILHPFRFGRNPFRKKREYSEEEKKKMTERLQSKLRSARSSDKDSE